MPQGIKLEIVFPINIYNTLKSVTQKMQKTPSRNPLNPETYLQDEQGNIVYMSKTGKPEEFIHTAILQTLMQLFTMNPAFLPQDPNTVAPMVQIQKLLEEYGTFVQNYYQRLENAKKEKGKK